MDNATKEFIKKIVEDIKDKRIQAGLTQKDIADRIGVYQQQYSRIETGNYNFTLLLLFKIAHAMGYKVEIKLTKKESQYEKDESTFSASSRVSG